MSQNINIKLKIFGFLYISKTQFIFIEVFLFLFFLSLTIFFFNYNYPEYIDDPLILFHKRYLKYVTLILCFLIITETSYYLHKINVEPIRYEYIQKRIQLLIQEQIKTDNLAKFKMAQRVQSVILNSSNQRLKHLNYFVIYRPKDIVSGDFYLIKEKSNKQIIIVADSQGHGVEGSLMSILGVTAINKIINETIELSPNIILDQLRSVIIASQTKIYNSIDLAIIVIDSAKQIVQFAGANRPLYLFREKKFKNLSGNKVSSLNLFDVLYGKYKKKNRILYENLNQKYGTKYENKYNSKLYNIKPDKMPIGKYEKNNPFSCYQFKYKNNDSLYLFSDGIVDQFGGRNNKKFLSKRLQLLLYKIQNYPLKTQRHVISKCIDKWKGLNSQSDDIVFIGLRLQ